VLLPLYGFLQGDALGLLILADDSETVQQLAQKLREAAKVRVGISGKLQVWQQNRIVSPELTLKQAGFEPLQRFDAIQEET
jgi:hypothetical protein